MRADHRRRGKAFEDPELVQAAVNLWLNQMRFESNVQAAAVLGGFDRSAVWRWRKRKSRPDTTALRRMIRLSLWQAEGWRAAWFRSVAWEDLSVEFVEGRELPNPFFLTLPTSTTSGATFPFGSLRDCGAILRALMDRFGVESRGHLIALLGMPHNTSAYDHVRHWTHGQWAIGPQYLARVLVLVLWAAKPHRFAALSDCGAWTGRAGAWNGRSGVSTSGSRTVVMLRRRRRSIRFSPSRSGRTDAVARAAPGRSPLRLRSRRCGPTSWPRVHLRCECALQMGGCILGVCREPSYKT